VFVPLIRCWVPSSPSRARVVAALCAAGLEGEGELSRPQFGGFAAELFRGAVLAGAADQRWCTPPPPRSGIVWMRLAAAVSAPLPSYNRLAPSPSFLAPRSGYSLVGNGSSCMHAPFS
jgi:hypothetical protein